MVTREQQAIDAWTKAMATTENYAVDPHVHIARLVQAGEQMAALLTPGAEPPPDETGWARWLRPGETPLQRMEREFGDCQAVTGLLAQARAEIAALKSAQAAIPATAADLDAVWADIRARWDAFITPKLNTPTREDVLNMMSLVKDAFVVARGNHE